LRSALAHGVNSRGMSVANCMVARETGTTPCAPELFGPLACYFPQAFRFSFG
jgi:hypothetical protein